MHLRLILTLAILCVITFFLAILLGSDVPIPPADVFYSLLGLDAAGSTNRTIIHLIRLPRAATGFLAGASLGVGGLLMQTLFRNPLAGPFVLGIQSGASLGAALVILAGSALGAGSFLANSGLGLATGASIGAGILLVLVLAVSRIVTQSTTLLIIGLLFGYATGAIVSILAAFSSAESLRLFVEWGFGSFKGVTRDRLLVLAVISMLGFLIAFLLNKPLNGLLLGETYARSLGIPVRKTRNMIIASTALLAGGVTAFCGPIVFIGVAVPHLSRGLMKTTDHRVLLPGVALMGALVAMWADIIAQVPFSPMQLPLNALTALIGTPVITWVILRNRNVQSAFS